MYSCSGYPGSFLLTSAVALLILGLNLGGNVLPWSHPLIIAALAVSVFAGAVLIWVERQAAKPVLPLKLLTTLPRGNIFFHNFFTYVGTSAVMFNTPLYFQAVQLDSPSTSGFRLAAPSVGYTCCGLTSGMIMNATKRPKPLIIIGGVVSLAGGIAMTALPHNAAVAGATIAAFFSLPGSGISLVPTSVSSLAFSSKEDQAVTSTTQLLWRSLGNVMGIALSSLLVQNALPRHLEQYVRGEDREKIIHLVRKSVHSIFDLDPVHRAQVQLAYEKSPRLAFLLSAVAFVLALALIVPIRIGRVDRNKSKQQTTVQGSQSPSEDEVLSK
ncbi:hypothetical protein IMSHALPRED_008957 [Imshaugia aleurites]|uniref:Uncharacterized protein n=1 Tax=Imshaugia aleurites TaxID=172621 RepID=A0A8H3G0T6_9LECA|nr:hypothetical protein IMSHALPRED_008957 [Imshaugia aleurites]